MHRQNGVYLTHSKIFKDHINLLYKKIILLTFMYTLYTCIHEGYIFMQLYCLLTIVGSCQYFHLAGLEAHVT